MQQTEVRNEPELISDEALMLQYAQGNFHAFEQLYSRHKGGLYRYFLRQLSSHSLAEDLFQDIWSKVISQAGNYQPSARFTTWLYTLAQHKLIDHVRHLKVVNQYVQEDTAELADSQSLMDWSQASLASQPDEQLNQHLTATALKACLQRLPLVQRECFLLKEEGGLTVEAISQVVSASYEACKSRLRSACDNLRQCMAIKLGQELN